MFCVRVACVLACPITAILPVDFHEIWYTHAIEDQSNALYFNFVQLIITTWYPCELMRWEKYGRLLVKSYDSVHNKS